MIGFASGGHPTLGLGTSGFGLKAAFIEGLIEGVLGNARNYHKVAKMSLTTSVS